MRTFRLFVSSPSDTILERQRVERVTTRLNAEFANTARIDSILWETHFYQAFATFQKQISLSTDCDIVVAIFRSRIGTELPLDFATMPGGEPYPSGTAYEVLTAIEKRQKGEELPDVYVFRYPEPPSVKLDDEEGERRTKEQWKNLKAFFERWFLTPQGHFKAAFQTFGSTDDFEAQLESLLREWLANKVSKGRIVAWPIETKGSPFPGLQAYGAKHAPVFFGRTRDVIRAVDQWQDAALRGQPFLLVIGASGTGKSSLVRAGLLPRFTTPGVIAEIDYWRIAVMRPSDSIDGAILALAEALMESKSDLPTEEEGRALALPEIAEGPYKSPADLAALLVHADVASVSPIIEALTRAGETERVSKGFDRPVRCDLALFIDQLDEIFAASVTLNDRVRFAMLLGELIKTGRIWITATLRADLYELFLRQPALFALKDQGAMLDLAVPGMAEFAEIIRKPAKAAGLVYETDSITGKTLDELLLEEAKQPDMLPLVQLALSKLYEARETVGEETYLTVKAYKNLGGMSGLINKVGEETLKHLGQAEVSRLPRLLRALAEPSHESRDHAATILTARSVSFVEVAQDDATHLLAVALVKARLMMTTGTTGQLRLTHQRVLSDWERARQIVSESADFFRIRDEVEAQRLKWQAANNRSELLLAKGLPLSEAESIVAKYGDEISQDIRNFVAVSRRWANFGFVLTLATAVLFAVLALAAGVAAKIAMAESARAEHNFDAAKGAVDGLIDNVAKGLRDIEGMRVETVRKILDTVSDTVANLLKTAPDNPALQRSKVKMLNNFVDTYRKANGGIENAMEAGTDGVKLAKLLVERDPDDREAQRLLAISLYKLGDVKLQANDPSGALEVCEESLEVARALAANKEGDADVQWVLWNSMLKVGGARLAGNDTTGALTAYQDSLTLARRRAAQLTEKDNAAVQRDLSVALIEFGNGLLAANDVKDALASYEESISIRRARAELERELDNTQARRDLALGLNKLGYAKLLAKNRTAARQDLEESIKIFRSLAGQDPNNAQAQRDLAVTLNNLGDMIESDDQERARLAYEESLTILRPLLGRDPEDVQAGIDLAATLDRTATLTSNPALFREALAILEKQDAANKLNQEQRQLIDSIKGKLNDLERR